MSNVTCLTPEDEPFQREKEKSFEDCERIKEPKRKRIELYYKVKGLVYGKYWGGGEGAYKAENYEGDDLDTIERAINDDIASGAIDSGMGYENVIGAYMEIETISTVLIEGKEYSNSEWEGNFFGNLTEKQEDFLMECNLI